MVGSPAVARGDTGPVSSRQCPARCHLSDCAWVRRPSGPGLARAGRVLRSCLACRLAHRQDGTSSQAAGPLRPFMATSPPCTLTYRCAGRPGFRFSGEMPKTAAAGSEVTARLAARETAQLLPRGAVPFPPDTGVIPSTSPSDLVPNTNGLCRARRAPHRHRDTWALTTHDAKQREQQSSDEFY